MKKYGVITITSEDYKAMTEAQVKLNIIENMVRNAAAGGELTVETRKLREVMGIQTREEKGIEIPQFFIYRSEKAGKRIKKER